MEALAENPMAKFYAPAVYLPTADQMNTSGREPHVWVGAPGPHFSTHRSEAKSASQLEDASRPSIIRGRDVAGREYVGVGLTKLRVIKNVVGVRPDLNGHAFPDADLLAHTHVEIKKPWSAQEVPSGVAERRRGSAIGRI